MISMNGSKFFHESTLGPLALTNWEIIMKKENSLKF
jgi:hypothetical protein